jgi:hypothetical protein
MNVSHESVGAKTVAAIADFGVDVCLFCVLLLVGGRDLPPGVACFASALHVQPDQNNQDQLARHTQHARTRAACQRPHAACVDL